MLENGKYYTGRFVRFAIVALGKDEKPAFQVTADFGDEGELTTTLWMGNQIGRDGKTNNQRIFDRLVEFGCDEKRLVSDGWRDHIQLTMFDKEIAAKAEEYNGKVNLKGLYLPNGGGGGGKPVELSSSPFAGAPDDDVPF